MWEEGWRGCSDCFYNSRRALPRRSAAVGKASQQGNPYRGQALPLPRACSGPWAAEEGARRKAGPSSVPGQADQAYSQPGPSQQRGWTLVLRQGTHSPMPQSSGEPRNEGDSEADRALGQRVPRKPRVPALSWGWLPPAQEVAASLPSRPICAIHHLPDPWLWEPGCASAGVPSRPGEPYGLFRELPLREKSQCFGI